jgi:hypothetical protein
LSIDERPEEVTSYSQPPANEHVRPEELEEKENSFVKSTADTAKTYVVSSDFMKERIGVVSLLVIGTPKVKVAVT